MTAAGKRTSKVRWLDEQRIALVGSDGLFVYELATGRVTLQDPDLRARSLRVPSVDGTPGVVPLAAFSSDQAAVTTEDAPNDVVVVRLDKANAARVRIANKSPIQGIALLP